MSLLLFDLFPELLNRVVIRRVARQLKDRQSVSMLLKEEFHRGAGVIPRHVLDEYQVLVGLLQEASEKGRIAIGIEPAFPALIKLASGEVVDQAEWGGHGFVDTTLS